MPEHGPDRIGIVVDGHRDRPEVLEPHLRIAAANFARVIKIVISHAQIDIELAVPAFTAVDDLAEFRGDIGAAGFDDLVAQEIGRNRLRLELFHRPVELGLHGLKHR